MSREEENNQATLSGKIASGFKLSHEIFGEGFYTAVLASERKSGVKDIIPIMVSEQLVDVKTYWTGRFVRVSGQFRSYNKSEGERKRLVLSVFVREFEDITKEMESSFEDENRIFIDGYICKKPFYRETPLGREIADILLAVNRLYGKSDYIPCICWGRNAIYADNLEVGTRMRIEGRIQSREYQKQYKRYVVHEVSANRLEVVADEH